MGAEHDPGREQNDEQEVLDEFHLLSAQKRQSAHHTRVTEHEEPPEPPAEDEGQPPATPRR